MPRIVFHGPFRHRVSSFAALNRIAIATYLRRMMGRKIEPSWSVDQEIGARFWRRQFTKAMSGLDRADGRDILDSLQTETDDVYAVTERPQTIPRGIWYQPNVRKSSATVLYLHGGGLAFHGKMSQRFAQMLCHHIGAPMFAPDYRLTPEHSHPAQMEDALEAWRHVTEKVDPSKIVIIGDSAGGWMVLMLLLRLRELGLPQPALGIGLCPWTDIGDRGASLRDNDQYDLVQGWMALQFGRWLDPDGTFGRSALSPISHDFSGLAPLYLQAGGREILHDMIADFAVVQEGFGADLMFDDWPTMTHDFQLLDSTVPQAAHANARITQAVYWAVDDGSAMAIEEQTVCANGCFQMATTK